MTLSVSASLEARIALFQRLVNEHDVSYDYSDDPGVWRRGSSEKTRILQLAEELPEETVISIWNARMDRYFIPEEAPHWYWKPKARSSSSTTQESING